MIVVIFRLTGNKWLENSNLFISAQIGKITCSSSKFFMFSTRIFIASQSISMLITYFALSNAPAIDNLPVPEPRSKISLFLISLNSNPAKKIISTALIASIQYCSKSIFGLVNASVF